MQSKVDAQICTIEMLLLCRWRMQLIGRRNGHNSRGKQATVGRRKKGPPFSALVRNEKRRKGEKEKKLVIPTFSETSK